MAPDEKKVASGDEKGVPAPSPYAEILERQTIVAESKVGYFGLYRYAAPKELLIIAFSSVCAVAAGAIIPTFPVSRDSCYSRYTLT